MAKFTTIDSLELEIKQIRFVYDNGTSRLIYRTNDGYETTSLSLSSIQDLLNLAQLTTTDNKTFYVNPKSVISLQDTASVVRINFCDGTFILVTNSLSQTAERLNTADNQILTQQVITGSGQINSDTQIAVVTTPNISVTLPDDRREITVINNSGGNITVLPNDSNTIMSESNGIMSNNSSWDLYLYNTNWLLK